MPLPDNLLNPIPGDNPSGEDLRYAPVYDQIKEARRQEDETAQGEWVHEVKKADYALVIKLATDAIANKSKDLQLGAWLTEALLRIEGFPGLKQGLQLLQDLTNTFWDTLYPQLEDGDAELRATPLQWVGTNLILPLRSVPLNRAGNGWLDYTESRKIPLEEQADTEEKANARRVALAEGKLAPEVFDKSFTETPKPFYAGAETALDECGKLVESFRCFVPRQVCRCSSVLHGPQEGHPGGSAHCPPASSEEAGDRSRSGGGAAGRSSGRSFCRRGRGRRR